jgi:hypothetical protein
MNYEQADRIRKKTLSDRISEKMVGGESFGKSISKSVSEGSQARMTNLKKKFDPMNIAKFMTGGSNLAPALVGRLMGRSEKDMKYFTGKQGKMDTASKIKPTRENEEGMLEMLNEIYLLLEDSRHSLKNLSPTEEEIFERELKAKQRHKELLEALKYKTTKEETATKKEEPDVSIFDNILDMFGLKDLGKLAIRGLGSLATAAVTGAGGVLLGGAAAAGIAYFMYKVLTDESSYDKDPNSPFNLALKQAESVGGLAGVKDEEDRIRKLPEYEKTKAEIANFEKNYNESEKLNDAQLKGYAERGPEAARAVQDYKIERDKLLGKPATVPTSATPKADSGPTATPKADSGPTATPTASAESSDTATPMPSAPASAAVMPATNENLEMNLPTDSTSANETINTTNINAQNQPSQSVTEIPSVRNMEETFQRMILYSTRVV